MSESELEYRKEQKIVSGPGEDERVAMIHLNGDALDRLEIDRERNQIKWHIKDGEVTVE